MVLIFGNILSSLISALGTVVIARILGASRFGILNIALIPISAALLIIDNGTNTAMIKYLVEGRLEGRWDKIEGIALTCFTLNVVISLIVSLVVYVSAGYLSREVFNIAELETLIRILSISIFSHAMVNVSTSIIVGFEKMEQSIKIKILLSSLKTFIGPVLVYKGFGVSGAALGHSLPLLFAGVFGLSLAYLNIPQLKPRLMISMPILRNLVTYAYPLFLAGLLYGGQQRIFEFLISLNVSTDTMGNYSAAISFSVLIGFFTSSISTASFPLLSKISPEDSVFKMVYQNIVKYESLVVYPITLAIIALSNEISLFLYGETYVQTPYFLSLYMINFLFIGLGTLVSSNLLTSQKQTKIIFRNTLIYVILATPMAFYLIPKYGILGYILITLTAHKVGSLYGVCWVWKKYNVFADLATLFKIFAASITGFLACRLFLHFFDFGLFLNIAFGGIIFVIFYVFIILLSRCITKKNLEDILSTIGNYGILSRFANYVFKIMIEVARE